MKIDRTVLLAKLNAISPGLSRKGVLEQSTHLVFLDGVAFTFNDEVACFIDFDLGFNGAVIAAPFISLLNKMKEKEIELELGDGELLVRGKNRRAGICMEKEILLPIDGVEGSGEWKPLPGDFFDALKIVLNCVSDDRSFYVLTHVHLTSEFIESCDNFQSVRHQIKLDGVKPSLVRGSSLECVSGMTEYSQSENWFHFRNEFGLRVSCRQQPETKQCRFPDLEEVLKSDGASVELPKGLDSAIDRSVVFRSTSDEFEFVTVEIGQKKLRIMNRGDNGWYGEVMKVQYDGDVLRFSISPKLLLDVLMISDVCVVGKNKIVVETEKWTYASCTRKL